MSPKDFAHVQNMMNTQQYCLKWNNHQLNLLKSFDRLLQSESFTDVTLACEGKSLRAHKVVLSACSSYFETLFEEHPDRSPIVILKDVKFVHVSQLVNFMYRGEINITQDMLPGLLKTAETLKVKGLAEVSGDQGGNPTVAAAQAAAAAAAAAAAQQFSSISLPPFRTGCSISQMASSAHNSTALTAALSSPSPTVAVGSHFAPFAALLNSELSTLDNQTASFFKRRREDDASISADGLSSTDSLAKMLRREDVKREKSPSPSPTQNGPSMSSNHLQPRRSSSSPAIPLLNNHQSLSLDSLDSSHSASFIRSSSPTSQSLPLFSMTDQGASSLRTPKNQISAPDSPSNAVLTPIPSDLSLTSLPDFLQGYSVFKLNDYLGFRTRQQFWEEPAVHRIMEAIKNKEIDMKSAAEILGVSYGTLYGRYREVYGYLKHAWVNKANRSIGSSSSSKDRSIWDEGKAQDVIQKVLSKELSLTAAAVRLGVDYNTFFAHLTDNGKHHARVALLTGSSPSSSLPSPSKSSSKKSSKNKTNLHPKRSQESAPSTEDNDESLRRRLSGEELDASLEGEEMDASMMGEEGPYDCSGVEDNLEEEEDLEGGFSSTVGLNGQDDHEEEGEEEEEEDLEVDVTGQLGEEEAPLLLPEQQVIETKDEPL